MKIFITFLIRIRDGKQYVCLNYHDYGTIDFEKDKICRRLQFQKS